jgi:hypothetical protein
MDGRGAQSRSAGGEHARIVWRLFSPSARVLSCQLRKIDGHFELVVENGHEEIVTAAALELEALHAKAAEWRVSLESFGYVPAPSGRSGHVTARDDGEPRAAFRGVIECADALSIEEPQVAAELRQHATTGLAALGLRNAGMTHDAIALSRQALARVKPGNVNLDPLLKSCEALLARIEETLPPADAR